MYVICLLIFKAILYGGMYWIVGVDFKLQNMIYLAIESLHIQLAKISSYWVRVGFNPLSLEHEKTEPKGGRLYDRHWSKEYAKPKNLRMDNSWKDAVESSLELCVCVFMHRCQVQHI